MQSEAREASAELDELRAALAASEAARAAAESEAAHYRLLFAQTPAYMCALSVPEYRYIFSNALNAQLIGGQDVTGRRIHDVLTPQVLDAIIPVLDEVVATGKPWVGHDFRVEIDRRGDGTLETAYLDGMYQPVLDATGQVVAVLSHATDVTERLTAATTLAHMREAERLKDEFLSVISHELRTPLNFIMGFASILEDELHGPLNPEQARSVGRISHGADRMLALVDDLLDFAKLQAGKLALVPAPTPYGPLVLDVLAAMQPLAGRARLDLTAELSLPAVPVLDGVRITQVLTNLVSNAIKFTPPGGRVTVRAKVVDDQLRTEVADTGRGIAAADLPRLFQRFGQLDAGPTRPVGGTGLGLAIARALVEAHGGRISVESAPGVGSIFVFELPLAGHQGQGA